MNGLLVCVCCVFRIQHEGMTFLRGLLFLAVLPCTVSLCRGFVTTELVSLYEQDKKSARTLGVLDVDGWKETRD